MPCEVCISLPANIAIYKLNDFFCCAPCYEELKTTLCSQDVVKPINIYN
jgi:hypothetical protein